MDFRYFKHLMVSTGFKYDIDLCLLVTIKGMINLSNLLQVIKNLIPYSN